MSAVSERAVTSTGQVKPSARVACDNAARPGTSPRTCFDSSYSGADNAPFVRLRLRLQWRESTELSYGSLASVDFAPVPGIHDDDE
jgi:hypothetical protein